MKGVRHLVGTPGRSRTRNLTGRNRLLYPVELQGLSPIVPNASAFDVASVDLVQYWKVLVGVAQLVRAPGCGPGGRGFDPRRSPQEYPTAFLAMVRRTVSLSCSSSCGPNCPTTLE